MTHSTQDLIGNAGMMFVAGELCRRGVVALPTVRNTEGIDLIASEPRGGKSVAIQVKTGRGKKMKWLLTKKNESMRSPTLFDFFVSLGQPGEVPAFHVVPSRTVAAAVRSSHRRWLETPGKDGRRHRDNPLRNFWDAADRYLDNWDALGLSLASPARRT